MNSLSSPSSDWSRALARDLKAPVYALVSLVRSQMRYVSLIITLQDLRNHGDSPHDPVHNYSAMAADVEEFMQQHDLRLPTLIGHSMSASVV